MKNHLFIGLGGQGGNSIAQLKKVFASRKKDVSALERRGQQWDFLYIDSSNNVINTRKKWVHFGEDLQLPPSSFLDLKQGGLIDPNSLALMPTISPWIGKPETLAKFAAGAAGIEGANQRRRFGRLLFARSAQLIRTVVCQNKIKPMLSTGAQCAIHIFASLAGGTGSGCIVDLVTMLRDEYPNPDTTRGYPIFLYIYITDENFDEAKAGYFHQNQYAALADLNALCCDQLHLTLLASNGGVRNFDGAQPINSIALSTQLNSRNQRISLEKQHQIMAQAAFERLYSYSSGDLDNQQKAVTGEDGVATCPGEPPGGPMARSYRFGSIGMRRWEVPVNEIKELLARDLETHCYRKLIYQNWNPDRGYLPEASGAVDSVQSKCQAELMAAITEQQVSTSMLPGVLNELNIDFERFHQGKMRSGLAELDLKEYELELRARYKTALNGKGIESLFENLRALRSQRLQSIRNAVHQILRRYWALKDGALGLAYIYDLLISTQTLVRNFSNAAESNSSANQNLERRLEARLIEWRKLTWLSRQFKKTNLALAHKEDVVSLLKQDLRNRFSEEDEKLANELSIELGKLASEYQAAYLAIKGWADKAKKRRDQLEQDLSAIHGGGTRGEETVNRAEFSLIEVQAHLKDQACARVLISNACDELRENSILKAVGNEPLTKLGHLVVEQEDLRTESADATLFPQVDQIHEKLHRDARRNSIIDGSVLDVLKRRYDSNPEEFKRELKLFLEESTTNLVIDSQQQGPNALFNTRILDMPSQFLAIGLPKDHPFGPTFKSLLATERPAVMANVSHEVYYHDNSTEIRMLSVVYFMAARFSNSVQRLHKMYFDAINNNAAGDCAYFTNLDPSGERGSRPDLLLPSPDVLMSQMKAALWIGARIKLTGTQGTLIQEGDNNVILVRRTNQGFQPKIISPTQNIDGLRQSADAAMIAEIWDAVYSATDSLEDQELHELRDQVREHNSWMESEHAMSSKVFGEWVKERSQIYKLLKL
jgi:hypothetical protein